MQDHDITKFRVTHRLRVRWAEVDLQGVVFNGHYLTYIDSALTEYWRVMGLPYDTIPARFDGAEMYVKKSTLEYHGSARYEDLLDVGGRCARIGNSSMTFQGGIFRDDRLLVLGELVYVMADPATRRSRPLPGALRDLLESFEAGHSPVEIVLGSWGELGAQAAPLRREVLTNELGIADPMDQDDADAAALHVLVRNRMGLTVATARLLQEGPDRARISRLCVTHALRGAGFGRQAVQALLQRSRARGDTCVLVQSARHTQGFYAGFGFEPVGAPYEQAGIRHVDLALTLAPH